MKEKTVWKPYPETKPRKEGKYFAMNELENSKFDYSMEILLFKDGSFPEGFNIKFWTKIKK